MTTPRKDASLRDDPRSPAIDIADEPPERSVIVPLDPRWRRLLPYAGSAAALLLFAAALLILHSHLAAYRPSDVRRALRTLEPWQPVVGLALTAISYAWLTLYDVQALRHVGCRLPYARVALASFTAYAFSHSLGFGSLIGTSVRYRLYTPLGLSTGEIAEVAAFVVITFMTGLAAVFPVVALIDPSSLEAIGIPPGASVAFGTVALLLTGCYVGLGWWIGRPIRLFGYPLDVPRPDVAVAQIALSVTDLVLVASVLYVCLPHATAAGFPHVLAVFVLAFVAGLISHVPGGLGVFDTVVLVGLSARLPADQVLAGLLVFRVVYQLLPLVSAGTLFGAVEAMAARMRVARAAQNLVAWAGSIVPMVVAGCTFLGGVVLLFSNAAPVSGTRLRLIETVLPLPVLEVSHFIGSIAGVLLLLLAHGLQRRSRRAWVLSTALLCTGILSALLKGFAWEEAIVLALLLLLVLLPARREFYRSRSFSSERYSSGWFLAVAVVLSSAFWLGLFSYKHLDDVQELWWRFALYGNASRFLRASVAVAVIVLAAAAYRLLATLRDGSTASGREREG